MSDKPPWTARNEHDRRDMVAWVNARLDAGDGRRALSPKHAARLTHESLAESIKQANKRLREGWDELELAQHGDIGPARELVRKIFPPLADLLQPPKLKRGEKHLPYTIDGVIVPRDARYADVKHEIERKQRIDDAVADVKRIKRIWQEHYGKTNRHQAQVSAVEIAVERHGVDVEEVTERLKRVSRAK